MAEEEKNVWDKDEKTELSPTNLFGFSILGGIAAIVIEQTLRISGST